MTEAELKVYTGLWVSRVEQEPRRVVVTGGDYQYLGWLVGMARKRNNIARGVVEDENKRLFIHNAAQIELTETH